MKFTIPCQQSAYRLSALVKQTHTHTHTDEKSQIFMLLMLPKHSLTTQKNPCQICIGKLDAC